MTSAYGGQDDGVWFQDADGGQTWWERDADTGEYYTQDTYGVYWSWNDWEAAQQHAFFTEDQLKELSEAYAAYEGKLRTFAESRNLMRDKVMNRGFYPSKGKFKGKKGKPRPSSSTSSSKGKGGAAMAADAMATVGSPNYSGCFICGSRDHEFRNCPKKSSNKAGKGGGIYMVSSMTSYSAENIYAAPVEAYGQNVPGTMPSLIGHVQQPELRRICSFRYRSH